MDIEAAADVLEDALIVEASEEIEDEAGDDFPDQEDLIVEAEVWEEEDALAGDLEAAEIQEGIDDEFQKNEKEKKYGNSYHLAAS